MIIFKRTRTLNISLNKNYILNRFHEHVFDENRVFNTNSTTKKITQWPPGELKALYRRYDSSGLFSLASESII